MLSVLIAIAVAVSLIWAETQRVEAIGRRQLEAWAARNHFGEIGCILHDCGYYRGQSWRGIEAMAFFNITICDRRGIQRHGFASCVLSSGDVWVRWAKP